VLELAKYPAKSMRGVTTTGIKVIATYLSEKIAPIINAYEPAAMYINISDTTTMIKRVFNVTKQWELVPEVGCKSNGPIYNK